MQAEKQISPITIKRSRALKGTLAILFLMCGAHVTEAQTKGEPMRKKNDNTTASTQAAQPNPDMKELQQLIGAWKVTGDAQGEIKYEWMDGGFFLMQYFDLLHGGRRNKGIEIIGHLQPLFGEPSKDIKSRVYSLLDGLTIDYVYELEGDTLTIWGGEKGSPAYYKGTFSKDGDTLTGSWVYPGGGYSTKTTRIAW